VRVDLLRLVCRVWGGFWGRADVGDGAVEGGFGRGVFGAEETVHFA